MAEKTVVVSQQYLKPIKILKWKVKQGFSVSIGSLVLLYDFEKADKKQHRKLKSPRAGTVCKLIAQEGAIIQPGEALFELAPCIHSTVMKDMCAECGADLRKDDLNSTASVPMIHSVPELKVSEELAQKIGKADGERLLRDKKLALLVDLDQTLIHTTNDIIPPNLKDIYHFQLYGPTSPWYHTRLRPGTHQFLSNVSPYFELHICTFGARNYAHKITTILDSSGQFFSTRVLSRDECFNPTSKTANLKALFPCGDHMVCIIDDREDVWSHASNLIHVKPYHFFKHTGDINAPPGLEKDENDEKEGVDLSKGKNIPAVQNNNSSVNNDKVTETKMSNSTVPDKETNLKNNTLKNKIENSDAVTKTCEPTLKENSCDKVSEKECPNEVSENVKTISLEKEENGIRNVNGKMETDANVTKKDNEISCPNDRLDASNDQQIKSLGKVIEKGPQREEDQSKVEDKDGQSKPKESSSEEQPKPKNLSSEEQPKPTNLTSEEQPKPLNLNSEKQPKPKELSSEEQPKPKELSSEEQPKPKNVSSEEQPKPKDLSSEEQSKCNNINQQEEITASNIDQQNVKESSSSEEPSKSSELYQPHMQTDSKEDNPPNSPSNVFEIEDPDDYLLYLEDILKRIHKAFYDEYDKMESGEVPDLKKVIPNVKGNVLKGCKMIFSGLVPTHVKLEHSRAYQVAKSLGAKVTQDFENDTTHLVAVRPGTAKVNAGRRRKTLKIVTPDWLWACAERWEHVDESIFPLNSKGSKNRHPPPHCSSPEHAPNYAVHETPTARKRTPSGRFMDTINPLMSFSSADIADMDKEVEDMLDESESEDDGSSKIVHVTDITIREKEESSSSSGESLTAEMPRGHKRNLEKRQQEDEDIEEDTKDSDDFPSTKFRRGEQLDSDLDIGQGSNSEGSVEAPDEIDDGEWNMMGAALEREFLSNN